jgi:molybdopterin synthase sulfur carrier subunit
MARIIIPTPLRKFTGNVASIETNGTTVAEAINALAETYPQIQGHLVDDSGKLRKFVRFYVGDEDIKALQNEATPVEPHTVISIIPAIAGGSW